MKQDLRRLLDVANMTEPPIEEAIKDYIPTKALIAQRESTHGDFDENARVWQAMCDMSGDTQFQNDRQRLAANMIFLKIARLMQNPNVQDHWDDIAGYARLGADGCTK